VKKKKPEKIATRIVKQLENDFCLCHNAGRPYLLFGNQAIEIGSQQYKDFVSRDAYLKTGTAPSETQLREIAQIQRGAALFGSEEKPVFVRVGAAGNSVVYLDLNDGKNTIIKIDSEGVRVAETPNVLFYRPPHLKPLPLPKLPGSLKNLNEIFKLQNDEDYVLLRSVLCFWLRGRPGDRGTFPVMNFCGPAGSGKTTKAKICKYLIDPATPEARTPGKDPRELFIAAKNQYCIGFDNVSYLDADMQDALCSLASRGGYGRKKNYTDDDESIFEECRPIITNGIQFKARPDLQSRMVNIELQQITSKNRKTEKQIWKEVEKQRPEILGGLLTALSRGIYAERNN